MNPKHNILKCGLLFLLGIPAAFGLVEVELQNVEHYHDIEFEGHEDPARFSSEMREYLKKAVDKHLPEGFTLSVTFTQVDLAGEYEPWRGTDYHTIRIMKSIYPPRLEFNYQLYAKDGSLIEEGDARLTDLNYLTKANPVQEKNEVLYYEKELLKRWIRNELGKSDSK